MLPEPYYRDERRNITLFHGDCRRLLPRLTVAVDLLLTDPPYGINYDPDGRQVEESTRIKFGKIAGDDGSLNVERALALALAHLTKHRHAYIFGRFDFTLLPLSPVIELVWDKWLAGLGDLTQPWAPAHEPVYFGYYNPSPSDRVRGTGRLAARLRKQSVLRGLRPNGDGVTRHPTEKPVAILREMIESSSRLGEVVLDPFAGSGSTLVAAALEGRGAIGVEIDERYCATAAERLRALPWIDEGRA